MTGFEPRIGLIEDVRLLVYSELAGAGRVDGADSLAARLDVPATVVDQSLQHLQDSRDLVLTDHGEIVLAHPFAMRNFGFSVMGKDVLWWGGCAWDAFAIPHLVPDEPAALIATRCPGCGTPHAWNVTRDECTQGDQVVYFATPMRHVWDDVVHACSNQRIFCSDECVDAAIGRQPPAVTGVRFGIPTLWRLASRWYEGRLERGYRRRDPASATAYFHEVGLTGSFWGNA